jgi:hypothetical protein
VSSPKLERSSWYKHILEHMPVEECGDIIIMKLAYAQRSSDIDYLGEHYNILKQGTGYLIEDVLIPES